MGWSGDVAKKRAALMEAQRRKIELQTAVLRAEMVPKTQVKEAWGRLIGNFRARCLAIPSKLAGRILGISDPAIARDKIDLEIREALAELSSEGNLQGLLADLRKLDAGSVRRKPRRRDPAAKADRKRVGRRKPPTES